MKKGDVRSAAMLLTAAALLLVTSSLLDPIAKKNTQTQRWELMRRLLPGSITFHQEADYEKEEIQSVRKGETGFIIMTRTDGYAGKVDMLVGVDVTGSITGLVIWKMEETFGLGQKALREEKFLAQFLNTAGNAAVGETIDALTGATVTSKAIAHGVNAASSVVTGADVESGATQWEG